MRTEMITAVPRVSGSMTVLLRRLAATVTVVSATITAPPEEETVGAAAMHRGAAAASARRIIGTRRAAIIIVIGGRGCRRRRRLAIATTATRQAAAVGERRGTRRRAGRCVNRRAVVGRHSRGNRARIAAIAVVVVMGTAGFLVVEEGEGGRIMAGAAGRQGRATRRCLRPRLRHRRTPRGTRAREELVMSEGRFVGGMKGRGSDGVRVWMGAAVVGVIWTSGSGVSNGPFAGTVIVCVGETE